MLAALGLIFCPSGADALASPTSAHPQAHATRSHSAHARSRSAGHSECQNATAMPSESNLALIRAATLCLINRERANHGEPALRADTQLQSAAQGHTDSMVKGDYFAHIGPSGDTPLQRMTAADYIYSEHIGYEVGENIAWGTLQLSTPSAVVAAWMASAGHRANILNARFRDTGIGVAAHVPASLAQGQAGGIYTQDFGVIVTG